MKKKKYYLCKCQSDSRMGAGSDYEIVEESQLKNFNLYAEYITVYELVSNIPLSKEAKKALGMEFSR